MFVFLVSLLFRTATEESIPPEHATVMTEHVVETHTTTTTTRTTTTTQHDSSPRDTAEPRSESPTTNTTSTTPTSSCLICEATGLSYPTTPEMELLEVYDDGLTPPSSELSSDEVSVNSDTPSPEGGGEPVFCRICREGLHEVNYDYDENAGVVVQQQPSGSTAAAAVREGRGGGNGGGGGMPPHPQQPHPNPPPPPLNDAIANRTRQRRPLHPPQPNDDDTTSNTQQQPTPICQPCPLEPIQTNHPYAENPLLAPCTCAGSMKFVHYLCIEQWRNRSNHPAARGGLNCETCHSEYSLPPPPQRRRVQDHHGGGGGGQEDNDWLEAMPPHVMNALRRPHLGWQIGAAIVRQRRLRPLAPIVVSPIVALYCRARRTLKKKGVSRRRWACSLCRRRARWKCVRCLRSYYCSRQCQNVSWHIVHKHVCYKPSRFYWSVAVYGVGLIWFVPGVLTYPLIYDSGVTMLWTSFLVMGTLGGGIATLLKKRFGLDIRGRILEAIVVLFTLWLANVGWGLVWAFFGEGDCRGVREQFSNLLQFKGMRMVKKVLPSFVFLPQMPPVVGTMAPMLARSLIFRPSKIALQIVDRTLLKTSPLVTQWVCSLEDDVGSISSANNGSCLEMTRKANPDFLTSQFHGESCSSDLNIVASFWMMASLTVIGGILFKRRDNRRRAAAPRGGIPAAARGRQHVRPHQD